MQVFNNISCLLLHVSPCNPLLDSGFGVTVQKRLRSKNKIVRHFLHFQKQDIFIMPLLYTLILMGPPKHKKYFLSGQWHCPVKACIHTIQLNLFMSTVKLGFTITLVMHVFIYSFDSICVREPLLDSDQNSTVQ
jgi:hypothetical protein